MPTPAGSGGTAGHGIVAQRMSSDGPGVIDWPLLSMVAVPASSHSRKGSSSSSRIAPSRCSLSPWNTPTEASPVPKSRHASHHRPSARSCSTTCPVPAISTASVPRAAPSSRARRSPDGQVDSRWARRRTGSKVGDRALAHRHGDDYLDWHAEREDDGAEQEEEEEENWFGDEE